ncbi:hypothetical protein [Bifidobacterium oedipodis]|uniref:Uncharacterized protein n=1 Tax=Bifidobacterium oedipodis TaxID=2675322 RepID=A0A7Y0EQN1_9BIFI|nr:hypothetical protein [Bifidobacterium sp. DSM 109957]NMM94585.1 hypothetical protein [Bifidobacterium sp. DSM 109957]
MIAQTFLGYWFDTIKLAFYIYSYNLLKRISKVVISDAVQQERMHAPSGGCEAKQSGEH